MPIRYKICSRKRRHGGAKPWKVNAINEVFAEELKNRFQEMATDPEIRQWFSPVGTGSFPSGWISLSS